MSSLINFYPINLTHRNYTMRTVPRSLYNKLVDDYIKLHTNIKKYRDMKVTMGNHIKYLEDRLAEFEGETGRTIFHVTEIK